METTKPAVLSAHPIEPAIRQRVMQALADIEAEHQVRVLFACESGSRGWGFASPDSDYDVRFVYVHALPWYLQVEAERDVIELPIRTSWMSAAGSCARRCSLCTAPTRPCWNGWIRRLPTARSRRQRRACVRWRRSSSRR